MRNRRIRFITEVGIFSAIGIVLDVIANLLAPFLWAQGGSISIALVPILIMGYRWGLKGGLLTGLAVGSLQIIWSPGSYLIHPIQVLLDYPIAYGLIGLSGIFSQAINKATKKGVIQIIVLSTITVGLLRTFSHVVSGVYFWWPYYEWTYPWEGSTIYNIGYMFPSIALTIFLLIFIYLRASHLILSIEKVSEK